DSVVSDYQNICSNANCYVYGLWAIHYIDARVYYQEGAYFLSDNAFVGLNAFGSPSNTGGDNGNLGVDILTIIAAVASALPDGEYAAVPTAVAAVLIKYLQQQSNSSPFTWGEDSSYGGVWLNDRTPANGNDVGNSSCCQSNLGDD